MPRTIDEKSKLIQYTIIRPLWLLSTVLFLAVLILLIVLRNHDAILVIGLHLNFKMGFIQAIESQCEAKGTPALILRNTEKPRFPYFDNCDRTDLGNKLVNLPDIHASYKELEINKTDEHISISLGGSYSPKDCNPNIKNKVAIIIPHRHR